MGSMDFRTEQRQTQTLSPRLQHAVRLLQLSSLEFAQQVHDALGKNPFLEEDTNPDDQGDEGLSPEQAAEAQEAREAQEAAAETMAAPEGEAPGEGDRDMWQADGLGSGKRADDDETSALDMMAVPTSLAAHLHGQLAVLPLTLRDLVLAKVIVESLDDDGYLRTDLQEMIEVADLDPPATLEEMQIALRRVQALEPSGVAARSVSECLLAQLSTIEDADAREMARHIIGEHLNCLAAKDVSTMARALGRTPAEIEAVCDRIRRLDPRPGWRFGSTQLQYVIPDVIVRKVRGQWNVQLNPAIIPKVRLTQVYAELFQRHRRSQNAELASHLQEARWTMRNVEQRFSTILSVAEAIVKRQKHFLDFGAMAMKPLGLREIADELGLHESTISRVTTAKYMATPYGTFELKYFFGSALGTETGGNASSTAVRALIKQFVSSESIKKPLSDSQISEMLKEQGIECARRTVAKYREALRIAPANLRKAL